MRITYPTIGLFAFIFAIPFILRLSNNNINDISGEIIHKKEDLRVFVNFAYHDADSHRRANLRFFRKHGMTQPPANSGVSVDYGLTVNGQCLLPECHDSLPNLRIHHRPNLGFDFGSHAAMLIELEQAELKYDAYIFLNAGVTGPFIPSYVPSDWHWVRAFTDKLTESVALVGTSIVCLPASDRGGKGPKVEGFAFALSAAGLEIVQEHSTSFSQHEDKVSAILRGEYAMTSTIFKYGKSIDSLLMAYKGVKWGPDMSAADCNSNLHPSRKNSYFGISLHPLETLFHKERWAGKQPVLGETFTMYEKFAASEGNVSLPE